MSTMISIDLKLERITGTLRLHSWMLTVITGGVLALVLKAFFV